MLDIKHVDDISAFYGEFREHIHLHYEKFAENFGGNRKLNFDFKLFQKMIDLGNVNIFTIWEDEKFVGYISINLSPSVLFKGEVDAVIDHFYFVEAFRGKGYSKIVVDMVKDELSFSKVDYLSIGLPDTEQHDAVAKHLGFVKEACVHSMKLGE